MYTEKMLLNILTPETISKLGAERIAAVKENGAKNQYIITRYLSVMDHQIGKPFTFHTEINPSTKRLHEVANGHISKNLSSQEKKLLHSELRFVDDQVILDILKSKNITKENMEELNELIKVFQTKQIEYTLALIKLERKYDLSLEQALRIIELYPALINTQYKLNDADHSLYRDTKKFFAIYKLYDRKKSAALEAVNENEILRKLTLIGKNYFDFNPSDMFILINKINELMVTLPEFIDEKQTKKQ